MAETCWVISILTRCDLNCKIDQKVESKLLGTGVSAASSVIEPLHILSARWRRYSLPLKKALTSGEAAPGREGLLLSLTAQAANQAVHGVGEVAPLPGDTAPLPTTCSTMTVSVPM